MFCFEKTRSFSWCTMMREREKEKKREKKRQRERERERGRFPKLN